MCIQMLFMIGICDDERGDMMYRLFDTNTRKVKDVYYEEVSKNVKLNNVKIENLHIGDTYGMLEELGNRMAYYPVVTNARTYASRALTIVGANSKGNMVGVDINGLTYNISEMGIDNISNYGLIITNKYMLDKKGALAQIEEDTEEDWLVELMKRYRCKCSLLGLKAPLIRTVNGNVTLISIDSESREVVVPSFVTHIGNYAMENCYRLEKVTLGKGIKYIGNHAFTGCNSLKSIKIPESVERIGIGVFCNSRLEKIDIKAKLKVLPDETFHGCNYLKDVEIGETVELIGDSAFNMCDSLENVIVPNSVKEIKRKAFSDSGMINITLNCEINNIPKQVFAGCYKLKELNIRNSIERIGEYAFMNCGSLKSVNIIGGDCNIKHIGRCALYGCRNLESINVIGGDCSIKPNSIKKDAFYDCRKLNNINIIKNGYIVNQIRITDLQIND